MEFDLLNLILDLWLKPSLFLLAVVLYCRWSHARAPENSHWLLVNLGYCILLMTVVLFFLPRIDIELLPASYEFWQPLLRESDSMIHIIRDNLIFYSLMASYFLIASFIFSAYIFDFISARKIAKNADVMDDSTLGEMSESLKTIFLLKRSPIIARSSAITGPMLWGHRSPIVVVPEDFLEWDSGRRYRVLAHEFAHIARRDWLIKNIYTVLSSVFWVLPSIWPLIRKTNLYAEFSCDDRVVQALDCRAEYAADLLDLSRAAGYTKVAPAFNDTRFLLQRIEQVLEGGRCRERDNRFNQCLKLFAVLIVLLPLASAKFIAVDFPKENLRPIQLIVMPRAERNTRQQINSDVIKSTPSSGDKKHLLPEQSVDTGPIVSESSKLFRQDRSEESILTIAKHAIPKANLDLQSQIPEIDAARSIVQLKGFLPTKLVIPEYPRRALQLGKQADIEVEFDIGVSGQVSNIRFINNKESRLFRRAIRKSLLSSQFSPLEINGMPIELKNIREVYSFIIDDTGSP